MKNPTEYLKYEYSDTEIAEAARDLATANRKRTSLEQRKKEVDAAIKAEIEEQNSIIGRLSQLIGTGFEYRDIEVRIVLDTPESGKKTIYRIDTGEEVAVKTMTDADRQMMLDLKTKAEAEEAAKQPAEPIITPPPFVPRLDQPGTVEGTVEPTDGAPLAQAAVMGGTHQRKDRKPRDRKAEAAADGSGEE